MKKHFLLLLILGLTFSLAGQTEFVQGSWKKVLAKATAEDKMIFVDVYTTWCGPCKKMSSEVFPHKKVGKFMNQNFINYKVDAERSGKMMASRYGVRSYPSFLIFDSQGKYVTKFSGYTSPSGFIYRVESALKNSQHKASKWVQEYNKRRDQPEFLYSFAKYLTEQNDLLASRIAQEYLATQKDWTLDKNMRFIFNYANINAKDEKLYQFVLDHKNDFYTIANEREVDEKITKAIIMKHMTKSEIDLEDAIIEQYEQVFPEKKDRFASELSLKMMTAEAKENAEVALRFYEKAKLHFEKYGCDDWELLEQVAWIISTTSREKSSIEQAIDWADQSIQLNNCYANNYTLATLLFRMGQKDKALKYANDALALAMEEELNTEGVKKFISIISKDK